MRLFQAHEIDEETPVQYVGVYTLKWKPEWGPPEIMFAPVDDPVYKAAPALLAACEALLEWYDFGIDWAYDNDALDGDNFRDAKAAARDARAAIALARGESG